MNTRVWKAGAFAVLIAATAALLGWGQTAPVYPQGLIIDPPDATQFEVSIWTDKAEYQVGELVTISYEVNKPAYIYIWDIMPTGQVQVIFPSSAYPGGSDNFVQAGTHQLPRSFSVAPPFGTEYLQILATTTPVDVASFPMGDPSQFQQQVEVQVLGLLIEDDRTWNVTSFEIVEEAPDDRATLVITSTPSGASVTIDSTFVGYTPLTQHVSLGGHLIMFSKPGYSSRGVYFVAYTPGTRQIDRELTPILPPNAPPTASFAHSPSNPIVGSLVQFNGAGSFDPDGSVVSYSWNLGDGTTKTGPFVTHRFTSGGTFTVTLTVTDDDGTSDSVSRTIQVGPTNLPPVAAFTFDKPSPAVGVWVQFDASSSFDSDGSIAAYRWDFGDGGTDTGPVRWHPFMSGGAFTVTLTVIDDDGASDSVSQTIQVGPTNLPPVAAFTFDPLNPAVGAWVQFNASSSFDSDGSIVTYQWDFGDGKTGVGPFASNRFTSGGTFYVTLTIVDDDGLSGTVTQPIQIGQTQQNPVAAFTYTPLFPTVGQTITFDASSSFDPDGNIVSYRWDRNGDGILDASGPVVQASFAAPGVVPVRLDVTDNDGRTSSATQTVTIGSSGGPSGAPPMGTTPGIFVWGTDRWHVTVNAGAGWSAPRGYRLELKTDGVFQNVNQPSGGTAFPMGLITTPADGGKTLLFEGTLQSGSLDHTFTAPGARKLILSLQLDIDGDGDLDESASFVYLRHLMVHPPSSIIPGLSLSEDWDLTFGLPSGSTSELLPTTDFKVGYTKGALTIYGPSISDLEGS